MVQKLDLIRSEHGLGVRLSDAKVLEIRQIIGIGRNYADHATEQGANIPTRPMVFMKYAGSAILSGDEIVIPRACSDPATGGEQVDYEAELAVIMARPARDVSVGSALEHVLGYCCANDVSARWWQKQGSEGQFTRGKSFDTFCPLGPWVTPREFVPDPQNLWIKCAVNGETRQNARTSQMMFPVATLIAELSRGLTLLPGTVILTGTPSGVGMSMKPTGFLKPGDEVVVEVEGLGALRNRVRAE